MPQRIADSIATQVQTQLLDVEAAWDESKHPRDHGKFTTGGGGGTPAEEGDPRDQPGRFVRGDAHAVAESYRMKGMPTVDGRHYTRTHTDGTVSQLFLDSRSPVTSKGSAHHYAGWTLLGPGGSAKGSGSQRATLEQALYKHKRQLGSKW